MLQRKIPSDDPDVQPRTGNHWPYKRMSLFVLKRATTLLRPQDAEALLACELWERDYVKHGLRDPTLTAWWAIAAAEVQNDRDKARDLLLQAFPRFQQKYQGTERAELAVALWRFAGVDAAKFLVTWFYAEAPQYASFPHQRAWFLGGLSQHRRPEIRQFLTALVQAEGYEALDWQSLQALIPIVNAWSAKPVVDDKQVEAAWHALGVGHFHQSQDEAKQKYPRETEALHQTLRQWRAALKMAILKEVK